MQGTNATDIIIMGTAIIGAISGLAALWISVRADKRSVSTAKNAEETRQDALWGDMIRATHPFIGGNVIATDMRPIILQFRATGTDLIDGLPNAQQQGIDAWLDAERLLLMALADQIITTLAEKNYTADEAVAVHENLNQVATALINNLRFLRKREPGTNVGEKISKLTKAAEDNRREVKRQMIEG